MERRQFFQSCGLLTAGIALCSFESQALEIAGEKVTPVSLSEKQYKLNENSIVIDLNHVNFLKSSGTAAKIVFGAKKSKVKVLIVHAKSGYKVFQNKCSHGGMPLRFLSDIEELRCTSFGHSKFDMEGKIVKGPARQVLKTFEFSVKANTLEIQIS